MAKKKIPTDAFDFYVSLGALRSYEAVAARYGVSKRGVTRCAKREGWQARLADLESLEGAREDHGETRKTLEALREVQRKAVAAIESLTFRSAGEALEAIESTLRLEHLLLDTPARGRSQVGSGRRVSEGTVRRVEAVEAPSDEEDSP